MSKKGRDDEDEGPQPAETLARLERLARLIRQASRGGGLVPVQWETLRYLARANRLSNSPGALARYLGATKGTISQTLATLEKKGLVVKQARTGDVRSVALTLTETARTRLRADPLQALSADISDLGGKTQRRLNTGVTALLAKEAQRKGQPLFGVCTDCRYYREVGSGMPAKCMKDEAPLSEAETALICIEHVPAQ